MLMLEILETESYLLTLHVCCVPKDASRTFLESYMVPHHLQFDNCFPLEYKSFQNCNIFSSTGGIAIYWRRLEIRGHGFGQILFDCIYTLHSTTFCWCIHVTRTCCSLLIICQIIIFVFNPECSMKSFMQHTSFILPKL